MPTRQRNGMERRGRIVVALLCAFLACGPAGADEHAATVARLCDDIIQVRWISAERAIGAADYDLTDRDGHTRHVKALVRLNGGVPVLDYRQALVAQHDEVLRDAAVERGLSRADEEVLRRWQFPHETRSGGMLFTDGTRYLQVNRDPWRFGESLAGGRRGVCIRYPDPRRTLIVELPDARHRHDDNALRKRFAEVSRAFADGDALRPTFKAFARAGAIDVNRDGVDDYPSLGVLSYRGRYHALRRGSNREADLDNYIRRVFDGNGAWCEEDPPYGHFLVIEDGSVYLNGTCNLTRLTGG